MIINSLDSADFSDNEEDSVLSEKSSKKLKKAKTKGKKPDSRVGVNELQSLSAASCKE